MKTSTTARTLSRARQRFILSLTHCHDCASTAVFNNPSRAFSSWLGGSKPVSNPQPPPENEKHNFGATEAAWEDYGVLLENLIDKFNMGIVSHHRLFKQISSTPSTPDEVEMKAGLLNKIVMKLGTQARVQEYETVGLLYEAQNNLPQLRRLLNEMKANQIPPTTKILNSLLRTTFRQKDLPAALKLFESMRANLTTSPSSSPSISPEDVSKPLLSSITARPDSSSYLLIIEGLVMASSMSTQSIESLPESTKQFYHSQVVTFFNEMQSLKIPLPKQLWTLVMLSCYKGGDYTKAVDVFRQMLEDSALFCSRATQRGVTWREDDKKLESLPVQVLARSLIRLELWEDAVRLCKILVRPPLESLASARELLQLVENVVGEDHLNRDLDAVADLEAGLPEVRLPVMDFALRNMFLSGFVNGMTPGVALSHGIQPRKAIDKDVALELGNTLLNDPGLQRHGDAATLNARTKAYRLLVHLFCRVENDSAAVAAANTMESSTHARVSLSYNLWCSVFDLVTSRGKLLDAYNLLRLVIRHEFPKELESEKQRIVGFGLLACVDAERRIVGLWDLERERGRVERVLEILRECKDHGLAIDGKTVGLPVIEFVCSRDKGRLVGSAGEGKAQAVLNDGLLMNTQRLVFGGVEFGKEGWDVKDLCFAYRLLMQAWRERGSNGLTACQDLFDDFKAVVNRRRLVPDGASELAVAGASSLVNVVDEMALALASWAENPSEKLLALFEERTTSGLPSPSVGGLLQVCVKLLDGGEEGKRELALFQAGLTDRANNDWYIRRASVVVATVSASLASDASAFRLPDRNDTKWKWAGLDEADVDRMLVFLMERRVMNV
ncbi:hypothetical protein HDU76_010233 [Blyttiomyces sp. JEL0837]|nr:hypothetical protein HDU76_010233 [Blyttiomyces sp. JEL0837]